MKPAGIVSGFFRITLRVIADFLIVQTAMLAALMVVALHSRRAPNNPCAWDWRNFATIT